MADGRTAVVTTGGGRTARAAGVRTAAMLKALAHPARFRMMELIHQGGGEICVCEFGNHLDLSQPTISHHLRVLREAGLIASRQEGTWVYHTVRRDAVAALAERLAEWGRRPGTGPADRSTCCDADVG